MNSRYLLVIQSQIRFDPSNLSRARHTTPDMFYFRDTWKEYSSMEIEAALINEVAR